MILRIARLKFAFTAKQVRWGMEEKAESKTR
jgi:hypothetical protein